MAQQTIENSIMIVKFSHAPDFSITMKTMEVIRDAISRVNNDESLKGLIFTGENKFFCSGFNLPAFLSFKSREEIEEFFTVEEEMLYELFTMKKPAIAAINGHCMAGGFIIAMGCDYRIATDNTKARMGMTEIKIGFGLTIAEMELMRFGLNTPKDLCEVMYEGERVTFQQALEKGYINETVTEDCLIERSMEKIKSWIDQPGRAFMSLKEGIRQTAASTIRHRLDTEDWVTPLHESIKRDDVRAVLEKIAAGMQ